MLTQGPVYPFHHQPFVGRKPILVQWCGIGIEEMQDQHHEQRTKEHRYRSKNPEQQGGRKVHCSQTHGPEIATSYHCGLDIAHGYVGVQGAHQEAGMDEVPRRVDEASEGRQETDEEGNVLHRRGGLARVAIDYFGHENLGGASCPCPDDGTQRNGERGKVARC